MDYPNVKELSSARGYFEMVMKPACETFLCQPDSIAYGMLACMTLHHMHEWFGPAIGLSKKCTTKKFKEEVFSDCSARGICHRVANGGKHHKIDLEKKHGVRLYVCKSEAEDIWNDTPEILRYVRVKLAVEPDQDVMAKIEDHDLRAVVDEGLRYWLKRVYSELPPDNDGRGSYGDAYSPST